MELLQPVNNDDHTKFRPIASSSPASNEELRDTHHHHEPTNLHQSRVPQSDQEVMSNLHYLSSIPSPICQDVREKVSGMADENGVAAQSP